MADKWTETTWALVSTGDFVKRAEKIWRVDRAEIGQDPQYIALTLFTPGIGSANGFLGASKPVLVRTEKNGEPTAAGRRLVDGRTHEGESALQRLLGAELIATQTTGTPPVVPKRMDAQTLASHLKLFHELYAGEVKAKDGAGLREVHREFHAAPFSSHSGRRIPHVHDDTSFGG